MNSQLKTLLKRIALPAGNRIVTLPFGIYRNVILQIDFQTQSQIYFGLNEIETHRVIKRMLRDAAWVIDVGSGYGELAILFACKSAAKIYAVEPGPAQEQICRNMAANRLPEDAIDIVPRCLGLNAADNELPLDSIAVDRTKTGFVKIDVDGGELDVLQSGESLVRSRAASFLVETHSQQLERDCIGFLRNHGYDCEIIDNAWWRRFIPEQRPLDHNRWFFAAANSEHRV